MIQVYEAKVFLQTKYMELWRKNNEKHIKG